MTWPPTVVELRTDMGAQPNEGNTAAFQQVLDAAVAFVQRVRGGDFMFDPGDPAQVGLPAVTADLKLGALRLAARWHIRRRSPDGMAIVSQEMGSARIPSFDADIDRLLGIGRHRGSVIA